MSNTPNYIDDEKYRRLIKRVAKLTSAYADGFRSGLQRNQFGERTRMQGVPAHGVCMSGKGGISTEFVRGYHDGFSGNDPAPKLGAPKREHGESRDKQICVRVSEQQLANYNAKGGKDWLLKELS